MPFLISSDGTLTIAGRTFSGPWTLAARFPNPAWDGSFVELFAASDSRFSSDTLSSYHGDTDYTLKYSAVAPAISADFGDPLPETTSSDLTWETYGAGPSDTAPEDAVDRSRLPPIQIAADAVVRVAL